MVFVQAITRFWKEVFLLFKNGALRPESFWSSAAWCERAQEYMRLVEPLDVVNWYGELSSAVHMRPQAGSIRLLLLLLLPLLLALLPLLLPPPSPALALAALSSHGCCDGARGGAFQPTCHC